MSQMFVSPADSRIWRHFELQDFWNESSYGFNHLRIKNIVMKICEDTYG